MLQASGLVVLPIYANYLSPAEFGVLDILDRIGMILLVGLMANGFRMATLTFFRQAETEADRERVSICLLYTSPSPRDLSTSRMPSSA